MEQADWLRVQAQLARIRLGQDPNRTGPQLTHEDRRHRSDARIPLGVAQGLWLLGQGEEAQEWLSQARTVLDTSSAGPQLLQQADWWQARMAGGEPPRDAPPWPLAQAHSALVHGEGGELCRLAQAFETSGRFDLAARLAIAVWAREITGKITWARALAVRCLAQASQGLDGAQAGALLDHLLPLPDPYPKEIERWKQQDEEDMHIAQILEINERLVDQEDLSTLLGAIVEAALQVTGASRGFLLLEEEGQLSVDLAMDSSRGGIAVEEVDWSQTIVRRALKEGGALRLADAGSDPDFGSARSVTDLELRSILCHAFTVSKDLAGVIWVDEPGRAGAFDGTREALLGTLAGQAALAIRQVRRLEEIRHLAARLEDKVAVQATELKGARKALLDRGLTPVVGGLIGESPPMRAVHAAILKIAPVDLSVLIQGESGTGKELVARALHDESGRKDAPFVSENCAALPESLVEAELFGYLKGTFTGADRDRPGLFERAQGGTLFLDEVGELPLGVQVKLLRVLETRKVRRLGDKGERDVDFRLVVATHRDLASMVEAGDFRADLLFRLDGVRIKLPSLSERLEDIPLLAEHFLERESNPGEPARSISSSVLARLAERPWPGNVRELSNEIRRLCVFSDGDLDDPELVRSPSVKGSGPGPVVGVGTLEELEKAAILAAIERCDGDKTKAAKILGISRAKVYQRLKEWGT